MGCQKLTYKKENFSVLRGGLADWQQQNTEKDPGPPICDDVFCGTGGNIDSGSLPENDIYFFHPDHLGSTSYITNISGETVQFNSYLPFGESFVSQKRTSSISAYLYNSKEQDPETGLYYYGARYYNPKISNWLSVDPLAGRHPSHSPYVYVLNNPLRYTDPKGLTEFENEDGKKVNVNDGVDQSLKVSNDIYKSINESGYSEWGKKGGMYEKLDPMKSDEYQSMLFEAIGSDIGQTNSMDRFEELYDSYGHDFFISGVKRFDYDLGGYGTSVKNLEPYSEALQLGLSMVAWRDDEFKGLDVNGVNNDMQHQIASFLMYKEHGLIGSPGITDSNEILNLKRDFSTGLGQGIRALLGIGQPESSAFEWRDLKNNRIGRTRDLIHSITK